MVYRYKPSKKEHEKREKKPYRRAGADSPKRLYGYRADAIDIETLFEIAKLDGEVAPAPKKRRAGEKLAKAFSSFFDRVHKGFSSVAASAARLFRAAGAGAAKEARRVRSKISAYIEKRRQKKRLPSIVPTLAGAFAGVLAVCLLSAFAVFYKLVISEYFGPYRTVVVPNMVGMDYTTAREGLADENYNITVSYEYSGSVPSGEVISQVPTGGTERKVYFGGSPCTLSIVVSRGEEIFTMKDYVGMRVRDARLELKNSGLAVLVSEDYSDSVPAGCVISTSPKKDESFSSDRTVVLHVSLGKEKVYATVPDVRGLAENAAVSLILSSGFVVGEINYTTSSESAGKVIDQSVAPHTSAEYGSEISFSVSAGQGFSEKKMPSLYGMTLAEAKAKLAEYGLVTGSIYAVESREPSGTVIAQTPAAGSAITSATLTVDIYVSS